MVVKKRTIEEIEAGRNKSDWERVRNMSEEELMANALSDPDAQPLTEEQLGRMKQISFAKHLRYKFGLTQEEFATRYRIPIGTLRDWEQHRSEPNEVAKAYLKVIAADPEGSAKALEAGEAA